MHKARWLVPLLALSACSREEAVQVREAPQPAPAAAQAPEPAPQAEPFTRELDGGLVVDVLEVGTGSAARRGGEVLVHYTARVEGTEEPFDSSWSRGVPDRWRLSTHARPRLIEGLVRGLDGLAAGTRCVLHVPAPLGYGSEGRAEVGIPPDAALIYEVRLISTGP